MSVDAATTEGVKRVLAERRRAVRAAAAAAETPPPTVPVPAAAPQLEQLPAILGGTASVDDLRAAFQREYLGLLLKPEVRKCVEAHLRSKDKKAARDMLAVLLPALVPPEQKEKGGGVTFRLVSRIARPGKPTTDDAIDVTPRKVG